MQEYHKPRQSSCNSEYPDPNPMETESLSDKYIDYETFLSPNFSPHSFANALILHTNTSDDPNLDLSTPLSRVLFDLQEIDSHIHSLTTGNASELLAYAGESRRVSEELVNGVEEQMKIVGAAYRRLEKEVVSRGKAAEEVLGVVERLSAVTRVVRGVGRVVLLGRQLEGLVGEWFSNRGGTGGGAAGEGDWKVLLRMGYTAAEMRRMFVVGEEKELAEVNCVKVVVSQLLVPAEQYLKTIAVGVVANFALPITSTNTNSGTSTPTSSLSSSSLSSTTTFAAQKSLEASLSRVSSAAQVLYLLSPPSRSPSPTTSSKPSDSPLLLQALDTFLNNQTTTSLAALSRVFSSLTPTQPSPPALDRSFLEIVQKIRGIVALEEILKSLPLSTLDPTYTIPPPGGDESEDDALDEDDTESTLLGFVLADLDTPSLPTLFFRNLSSGLETLVRNVLARGGVAARGLRAGKDKLREGLRGVVERGLAGEGEDGSVWVGDGRRGERRKRRVEEREVGVGVVMGGVERGFVSR